MHYVMHLCDIRDVLPCVSWQGFSEHHSNGREGVWRLLHIDYHAPRDKVLKEMEDDVYNLQPESEGFILAELQSGVLHSS